ncbi:MAG: TIGR02996 domain-containing protein [Polyangiaceae bacterium]|nr:TIGR02996 domain-containing protein [Polyangiaceae bacterium]
MTDLEERVFLEAILDAPDDDTPRHVYADWLHWRGDIRGELIAVQLRIANLGAEGPVTEESFQLRAREAEILDRHGTELLGPLQGVVRRAVYRRGFLSECLCSGRLDVDSIADNPRWSTVETLEYEAVADHPVLPRRSVFRSLRRVGGITWKSAAIYACDSELAPIDHLLIDEYRHPSRDMLNLVATRPGLAALRRIDLGAGPGRGVENHYAPHILWQLRDRIEVLGIEDVPESLGAWIEWFVEQQGLQGIVLGMGASWRHAVRDPIEVEIRHGARALAAYVRYRPKPQHAVDELMPWLVALGTFGAQRFEEVIFDIPIPADVPDRLAREIHAWRAWNPFALRAR